ncbi:hypothetical protein PHLCEN_2v1328 [Hermanssonia centrifuga]|uniref:Uncharacterized protein n=1 Tax=Hermanssonia centrifuga TaxID=98765 RepID=A0A2R6S3G9_9APHY|nr:hypothetical protein PHLCEN_2v1328 [Hermanssonia centrifuga]
MDGLPLEPEPSDFVDEGLYRNYHPKLTGRPCDQDGKFLDPATPPPPRTQASRHDWTPYAARIQFDTAKFLYQRTQMSQGNVDLLMDLWAASLLRFGGEPPFANVKHMHELIDSTPLGDAPWTTMEASYTGELPANPPSWMTAKYELCFRDPRVCARNMLANLDFAKEFDTTPYREYDGRMVRQYCNLLSGDWAWEQADLIAEDPDTHGAMVVPLVLGSDKTTVSVGTGDNEYYPLYISLGNVYNNVRRAHRNAVLVVAFLAIPKGEQSNHVI